MQEIRKYKNGKLVEIHFKYPPSRPTMRRTQKAITARSSQVPRSTTPAVDPNY